jgi:AcrR family transcriptional regulator
MVEGLAEKTPRVGARDRILNSAYELFSQKGIRAVGVDEVIAHAGVAKATLYKHFPSKTALVLGFLAAREQRWWLEYIEAGARERGDGPKGQLLAIFDLFDEWFSTDGFADPVGFIHVLLEMGPDHPIGQASIEHLAHVRSRVKDLADEAGLRDTEAFARSWQLLMLGSIIAAREGDAGAARRAQAMAERLISEHAA